MITIQYVSMCDACGRQVSHDQPVQMIWGLEWMRPRIPSGWTIILDDVTRATLICDHHAVTVEAVKGELVS